MSEKIDKVVLLDHGHNDLTVVNAARCSFDKQVVALSDKDRHLIKFLAKNGHWTPFGHPQFSFVLDFMCPQDTLRWLEGAQSCNVNFILLAANRLQVTLSLYAAVLLNIEIPHIASNTSVEALKAHTTPVCSIVPEVVNQTRADTATFKLTMPVFVERQWTTHKQNLFISKPETIVRNEVSRRYIDTPPQYHVPADFRLKAENVKQGSSSDVLINTERSLATEAYLQSIAEGDSTYKDLLGLGVCPEQARAVLPLAHLTTFWETGTLEAWKRVVRLRLHPHAQKEIREYAQEIDYILRNKYPTQWDNLKG